MMKVIKQAGGALFLACMLQGCMTVASISVSQIPVAAARKHKISASASNVTVLLIPFGSSFPERARGDLLSQCQGGKIEGLLSKHQVTDYFLGLFFVNEVVMEGYCLHNQAKG